MFLYHVITSSGSMSDGCLPSSTMIPSESITLYVGIAVCVEGRSNASFVTNLLLTAPGKWTLERLINTHCVILDCDQPPTGPNRGVERLSSISLTAADSWGT